MRILNFGSLNLDYTYRLDHFVKPGETEASFGRTLACGGKGLNQSVALAKSGAEVIHAGAVGKEDGAILLETLKKAGVNTDAVKVLADVPSGSAFIQVTESGENAIVLDGGANQAITKEDVKNVLAGFAEGDWIVLQNEISEIPFIIEQAHARGMKIVLNPSPMNPSVMAMPLEYVNYFLLNEDEAAMLAGPCRDTLSVLSDKYPGAAILITLGPGGCVFAENGTVHTQNSFPVTPVDTTGAGDTFTGFFIGSLAQGKGIEESLELAAKAAAISVTRKGASTSIPDLEEVKNARF